MKTNNIKVLAVAPYEGMKHLMENVAKNREKIELTTLIGDLEYGVNLVKNTPAHNYDVILSRGGTAELIQQSTDVPVIEVNLSVYDILRAIRIAENHTSKFSVVGFPNITKEAFILRDLLQFDTDIHTINDSTEALEALEVLKANGCQLVVCDMITFTYAREIGLNAILITSGIESIETAFDQIEKITNIYAYFENKNQLITQLILEQNLPVAIFDKSGKLYFSSKGKVDDVDVNKLFIKEVDNVLNNQNVEVIKKSKSYIYSITGKSIIFKDEPYALFYLNYNPLPLPNSSNGVKYLNKSDAMSAFNESLFKKGTKDSFLNDVVLKYSQTDLPILILGDIGTGKDSVAYYLYTKSELQNNPIVVVDCNNISNKHFEFLMQKVDSPLYGNNYTFYFKNLHCLEPLVFKQFITLSKDINLFSRNRVFFSIATNTNNANATITHDYLLNNLNLLTMHLPNFSDSPDIIHNLSSIYINELNMKFAKHIIGFESSALELLTSYSWSANFNQFRNILTKIFVLCDTTYIKKELVESILSEENLPISTASSDSYAIDNKKTLNDINKEIALQVLKEENNNQSRASVRLGISRTTLWRLLKE